MSEHKDFTAALDSDSRRTPVRIAFVTRRTSPHVQAREDQYVMTFPEAIFRTVVAVEALVLALVLVSLFWNAPLERLADPMQTPNPAKAPWYFLGLQELLHYFPPVIAGVLIPALVVIALIVIPYFNINVEAESFWVRNRPKRLRGLGIVIGSLVALLMLFDVYAVWVPTLIVGGMMVLAAFPSPKAGRFRRWIQSKPLSFWIMTWFLIVSTVLTIIGTFFRGAGWAWVWPWSAL